MASESFDDIYKIVKTTFLSQYIPPSIQASKNLISDTELHLETTSNGQTIQLQVLDLSGDPLYRSVSEIFIKHSLGAFILFDLSSPNSFKSVSNWVKDLRVHSNPSQVFIIGNKKDLRGKSKLQDAQEGQTLAQQLGAEYIELSSFNKAEVDSVFKSMIHKISLTRPVESSSQSLFLSLLLVFLVVLAYYVLG
jgi:small GTP-binding protein